MSLEPDADNNPYEPVSLGTTWEAVKGRIRIGIEKLGASGRKSGLIDNGDNHDPLKAMALEYVLLALGLQEQRIFTAHMHTCKKCQRVVAEMRAILDILPDTVPPRAARQPTRPDIGTAAGPECTKVPRTRGREERQGPRVKVRGLRVRSRGRVRAQCLATPGARVEDGCLAHLRDCGRRGSGAGHVRCGNLRHARPRHYPPTRGPHGREYDALRIMAGADVRWQLAGSEPIKEGGILAASSLRRASSMVLWGLPKDPGNA